jgi:hypothetical protein
LSNQTIIGPRGEAPNACGSKGGSVKVLNPIGPDADNAVRRSGESRVGQFAHMPEARNEVKWPMLLRFLFALRSVAAVVGGYLVVVAGTILTFNVFVGQVTVDSNPGQIILGTIGAMLAGIAGGVVAGVVAPRFPLGHAAAVLLFLALDTASVLAKGTGPAWFDLAGSSIIAISVLFGGWIIARRARSFVVRPAV